MKTYRLAHLEKRHDVLIAAVKQALGEMDEGQYYNAETVLRNALKEDAAKGDSALRDKLG